MPELWFWQLIVSPHMAELAVALARLGYKVKYVAERPMSEDRAQQGWSVSALPGVALDWAANDDAVRRLVEAASPDSVHICQGVRANGRVAVAQRKLAKRGLEQWIIMETVDDAGLRGVIKRLIYRYLFWCKRRKLTGILATGHNTQTWIAARGVPTNRIFSFAYFLPNHKIEVGGDVLRANFIFLYVGRLIPLKRVDWLINELCTLEEQKFDLWVVGEGPEEQALRKLARGLGTRVKWLGKLPINNVPAIMRQADCLVLPSVHDGWGAVASEALMTGTPVICSNACGVAAVVQSSGRGGVFETKASASLRALLLQELSQGKVSDGERHVLSSWAKCLSAKSGASYLDEIITSVTANTSIKPLEPWKRDPPLWCNTQRLDRPRRGFTA